MNKSFFSALCGLAMAVSVVTAAQADDAAYNTSSGDSITMGTDPNTGGEAPGDAAAMESIQEGTAALKESIDQRQGN